jgi:Transposase DDE domain
METLEGFPNPRHLPPAQPPLATLGRARWSAPSTRARAKPAWRKMRAVFMFKQDEFLAAYAKRARVESTFSAVKRKFGQSVKSKTFTAQANEILCKILAHNLTCLVLAMRALGIEPSFLTMAKVPA